jgi:drug/metabolite transporter superfamily protein YnfA
MKKETSHFYFIIGVIFIVMGIFSIIYGYIIPTQIFTRNDLPSMIFIIAGVILIIMGVILTILLRKQWKIHQMQAEGGIEIHNQR